jgi:hypothetical protein
MARSSGRLARLPKGVVMSDTRRPADLQTSGEGAKPGTYQPPAIEWEEEIDVKANLASACGKVVSETSACASYQES